MRTPPPTPSSCSAVVVSNPGGAGSSRRRQTLNPQVAQRQRQRCACSPAAAAHTRQLQPVPDLRDRGAQRAAGADRRLRERPESVFKHLRGKPEAGSDF